MWSQLGRREEVDVCLTTEPDARTLVRAKGEWIPNDLWIHDYDYHEEDQDVVTIVCDGGQRLGGVLLCLTCFRCLIVLCLHTDFAVFVVVIVFPSGGFPFFRQLRDRSRKIFRSSPASDSPWRIAASVRNGGRRTALRGVQSRCLFERVRSPAAAKEKFCNRETDIFSVRGKSNVRLDVNNVR